MITRCLRVNIRTEFWSRQSKMLTLLQLKSSLRHAALFPKKFILDVTIRTGVIEVEQRNYQQWEEEILSNMHCCDDDDIASIDSARKCQLRCSLSTSALSNMENILPKWDRDLKSGNKNMVMQNEPLPIYATPPKDMPSGDLVSVASSNGPSDCHTPPESVSRHPEMSGATLSRRVMPRKRKFDEVGSYEFHSSAQKKLTTKLAGVVKKHTSVISLNEQFSSCETNQDGLQSFSNQTHQLFKKVKGDVLKDRTNTLRELIIKCIEKLHQPLESSVCPEEICFAHCNSTEPILSSTSHCIQEPRAVLTQEHRMAELSEDVCNSDMRHTETPKRSACYDGSDGCYTDATECVDVNNGASCLCTQAVDHSEPMRESWVSQNAVEDKQWETDTQTQHCCAQVHSVLKSPVYPRPVTYRHILTRRQYQSRIKSTKDKVYLNVEDVLASGGDLPRPELRTRSKKAESYNLKKLLQDVASYPTVVLCRVDENVKEQPHEN
ncbi:hypothetical protein B7P43_G07131 [Cryptotermes secundus]|nr:hypothetical protein B7P43_G07131 [Cryptotermes secundus]